MSLVLKMFQHRKEYVFSAYRVGKLLIRICYFNHIMFYIFMLCDLVQKDLW